jgi:hypothetical protein
MTHVVDIQVTAAGNLVKPVPVITVATRGVGQKMKFKSNKKTVIRLDGASPFVGLRPNTSRSIRPAVTLEVRAGLGTPKKYKVLCGRLVAGRFLEWGGRGFETPPIP